MKDDASRTQLCTTAAMMLAVAAGCMVALREFAAEPLSGVFAAISLTALPPAERHLVEFLLLLPVAALIVCVFRNLIGVPGFGTFAPALVGLMFRDWHSLPVIGVFVGLLLTGWIVRRFLDRLRLLQVPRAAVMLSLMIAMLVGLIVVASRSGVAVTQHVSLFPIIVLAGMVERFWLLEAGDGTAASFRTLVGTVAIAVAVAMFATIPVVPRTLLKFPEALGLVVAVQLLIGRYMGYRLSELWRFRDLAKTMNAPAEEPIVMSAKLPMRRF
jgi:hypothetical protein